MLVTKGWEYGRHIRKQNKIPINGEQKAGDVKREGKMQIAIVGESMDIASHLMTDCVKDPSRLLWPIINCLEMSSH